MNMIIIKVLIFVICALNIPLYSMHNSKSSSFDQKWIKDNLILETEVYLETNGLYITEPHLTGKKSIKLVLGKNSKQCKEIAELKFDIEERLGKSNVCWIRLIETEQEYRNQGYATLLLKNLQEESLKIWDCSKIILFAVNDKMPFYTKRKFQLIEGSDNWMKQKIA